MVVIWTRTFQNQLRYRIRALTAHTRALWLPTIATLDGIKCASIRNCVMTLSARPARRLIIIYASLAASLIAHSLTSAAAASSASEEPVFGLYYYPQEAHFAELKTNDLLPACKNALSDITPRPTTLTLFSQYKRDLTQIYIAGYDDNLKIYVIRDGTCDAGIPIMAILQRHHIPRAPIDGPMLSNEEVSDLFGDALVRYANALGGGTALFPMARFAYGASQKWMQGTTRILLPSYLLPAATDLATAFERVQKRTVSLQPEVSRSDLRWSGGAAPERGAQGLRFRSWLTCGECASDER